MNVIYLAEPKLEFGGAGQEVDIRFGLLNNGVFDRGLATAPSKLRLGVIGTAQTIESFLQWINKCRTEVPAKDTHLKNLFPHFPGFVRIIHFTQQLLRIHHFNAPYLREIWIF